MPVSRSRRQYLAWAAAVLLICSLGIVTVQKSPTQVLSSLNPFGIFMTENSEATQAEDEATAEPVVVETPKADPVAEAVVIPVATPVETPEPVLELTSPAVVAPKTPEVYYLAIAGSFANKTNAKRLMRRLRQQGFETAYIMPQTKNNELVKVAAVGSTDKNEVLASIEKVSRLSGSRAWVCKIE